MPRSSTSPVPSFRPRSARPSRPRYAYDLDYEDIGTALGSTAERPARPPARASAD